MPILRLTYEDIAALINLTPPRFVWEAGHEYGFIDAPVSGAAGGAELRLKLMAAYTAIQNNPLKSHDVELTAAELWLLDTVLWNADYYKSKMLNGTPLIRMLAKVWTALTEHHAGMLAPNLQPDYQRAGLTPDQRDYLDNLDAKIGLMTEEDDDDDPDEGL